MPPNLFSKTDEREEIEKWRLVKMTCNLQVLHGIVENRGKGQRSDESSILLRPSALPQESSYMPR